MKKLYDYICDLTEGRKVKRLRITPAGIYELIYIYNAIARKEKPEFINQDVKNALDKCGIKTVQSGIGWRVV